MNTLSPHKESLSPPELLMVYQECGQQMRFYADARFKIMTVAVGIATVIFTVQRVVEGAEAVLSLIGLISTIVLFSIEYRYGQAWLALFNWAQNNVEDRFFGVLSGPLGSYRYTERPWYILRATTATRLLYLFFVLIWTGNALWYWYPALSRAAS